jgi:hypothetical protein
LQTICKYTKIHQHCKRQTHPTTEIISARLGVDWEKVTAKGKLKGIDKEGRRIK